MTMHPTRRLGATASMTTHPTRRTLLSLGTAGAAGALLVAAGPSRAAARTAGPGSAAARLRELEHVHGARVGAFAYNLATGAAVRHRADVRFPMLSTFKTLAAAAVLRDLDRDGEVLGLLRPLHEGGLRPRFPDHRHPGVPRERADHRAALRSGGLRQRQHRGEPAAARARRAACGHPFQPLDR